jgi:FtsH-binding integral membrane protein
MTDRRRTGPPRHAVPARAPQTEGLHIGPLAVTPTGILLLVALIGSVGYLLYAITVREATQIPMLAAGAVVLGIVFVAVAVAGLVATWRSSVSGRDGRALAHALVGGVACLAAAGCFAAAIILGLVSGKP